MTTIPKKTNLTAIKTILAIFVFTSHAHILAGIDYLDFLNSIDIETRVQSFFVISGFFVFLSYDNRKSVKQFLRRRFERLYPPYAVAVIFCTLIGIAFTTAHRDFQLYQDAGKYLIANITTLNFIHPSILGAFADNKISAINGALWTMKIEFMFYLSVPLIYLMGKKIGHIRSLVLLLIASAIYAYICSYLYISTENELFTLLRRQLPGQIQFFAAGAILYRLMIGENFEYVKGDIALIIVASVCTIVTLNKLPVIYPISLSIAVVGLIFSKSLGSWNKFGDLSFGIYLYHFPIIQSFVQFGWFEKNPTIGLAAAGASTLAAALLSCHFVENSPWKIINPSKQKMGKITNA
ncbi:acyltransferase family protein [Brevundimonas sp. SL130]|uniref:acyltransferase family protein n=1 Tax=Brevundimonas sp. SL130 TaxID=2995143 RepID=UPI00226D0AE1|nr:acyltransferase [Brevundimonas sp. SL130]WAC59876.1 acyltransferase [Brevundimonas sp. SL130]